MKNTAIQWADGTVSPVMGCDGCPLRRPEAAVIQEIRRRCAAVGLSQPEVERAAQLFASSTTPSRRQRLVNALSPAVDESGAVQRLTREIYAATSRCYAGVLTDNRGGKVKGYPDRFENIALFPGRMAAAARTKSWLGVPRPHKPWLNGCRYLWFVNDMGDALSRAVSFEFLKREIVDVAASSDGQRHVWLWLTKRPKRMAQFAQWLLRHGRSWPANLVPMTSVIHSGMALQVPHLGGVPALLRGLSVEPLWEPVKIDLRNIDWVIVGGESGALARPFELQWARQLREDCRRAGVAFFVKQLGANALERGERIKLQDRHGGDWSEWPADLRLREVPEAFRQAG
jgi:protein gp37